MTFVDALKYTLSVDGVRMTHPDTPFVYVDQVASMAEEDTYEAIFTVIGDYWRTTQHKYTFYVNGPVFKVLNVDNPVVADAQIFELILSDTWECTSIFDIVPIKPHEDDSWAFTFQLPFDRSFSMYVHHQITLYSSNSSLDDWVLLQGDPLVKLMYKVQSLNGVGVIGWTPLVPDETIHLTEDEIPVGGCKVFIKSLINGNNSLSGYRLHVVNGYGKTIQTSGSLMSLVYGTSSDSIDVVPSPYCFRGFFSNMPVYFDNIELSAMTLTEGCYSSMFEGSLFVGLSTFNKGYNDELSILPATELPRVCYRRMFYKSRYMDTPIVDAETIGESSCASMYERAYPITRGDLDEPICILPSVKVVMADGCNGMFSRVKRSGFFKEYHIFQDTLEYVHGGGLADMFNGSAVERVRQDMLPPGNTKFTANNACSNMFSGCTELTEISPGCTISASAGCHGMFYGCFSLTTIPKNLLPTTTLAEHCYDSMFRECTGLTEAPDLPAQQLAPSCYAYMFSGCTALTSITVGFTDWHQGDHPEKDPTGQDGVTAATYKWMEYVGADTETGELLPGTFTCPAELTEIRGDSAIPEGWDVVRVTP